MTDLQSNASIEKVYAEVCATLQRNVLARVFFYNVELPTAGARINITCQTTSEFAVSNEWTPSYKREVLREMKSRQTICVIAVDNEGEVVRTNVYSLVAFMNQFRADEKTADANSPRPVQAEQLALQSATGSVDACA